MGLDICLPLVLNRDMENKAITTRQAYDKGRASQRTGSDWDDALVRFSQKYCSPHGYNLCPLETAWADGWDDGQENNRDRRP